MAATMGANENTYKLFEEYSFILTSIVYVKTEGEKKILNKILDDFNSLDYNSKWMENNDRAVLVLHQCCSLIPPQDSELVIKACQLAEKLIGEQHVVVEGLTLNTVYNWCTDALQAAKNPPVHLQILQTLQKLPKTDEKLLHNLNDLLKKQKNYPIYIAALKCLENVKRVQNGIFDIYEDIFNTVISEFSDPVDQCKCLITAIRGVANLIRSDIKPDSIPFFLGLSKSFMAYKLSQWEFSKIEKTPPSNFTLPEQKIKPGVVCKDKYTKKQKKKTVTSLSDVENDKKEFLMKASDSDASDCETNIVEKSQIKVRHAALVLLGTLVNKVDSRILTKYLPNFLPQLVNCLNKEPSSKCRAEVLIVLSLILTRFKPFLNMADSTGKSSFTTFAQNVADILKSLHINLERALAVESSLAVITRLLITISDLIRSTPYYKLEGGLLENLAELVRPLIEHKDVIIRTSALSVFGCIASVPKKTSEIDEIILKNDFSFAKLCLEGLQDFNMNVAVIIEMIQVFGAVVRHYFYYVFSRWFDDVVAVFNWVSRDKEPVKFYAAKFLEMVAIGSRENLKAPEEKRISMEVLCQLWTGPIQYQISRLLLFEDGTLQSIALDCISNLGVVGTPDPEDRFLIDYLPRASQVLIITHLVVNVQQESPNVRSSAIRGLAALIQISSMAEDETFFVDVVDCVVKVHKDPVINVRYQAAWLMGALSDVLLADFENITVLDNEIFKLVEPAICLLKDNKQITPNALRAFGNLIRILPENLVYKHREKIGGGILIVIQNAISANYLKAKWNACYAMGNILMNPIIFQNANFIGQIFPTLLSLVKNYKNFKVRISAAFALASPPIRSAYGEYYLPTWSAFLTGLDNAQNMDDFQEYQHRDQLIDQLCLGLAHVACLVSLHDMTMVSEMLYERSEGLKKNLKRCKERVIPEKCSVIEKAHLKLLRLKKTAVNKNDKACVELLLSIFDWDYDDD